MPAEKRAKNMTEKTQIVPVVITLRSVQLCADSPLSLFSGAKEEELLSALAAKEMLGAERNETNFMVRGTLMQEQGRLTLSYAEPQTSGMEGTTTQLLFDLDRPQRITLMRNGAVSTAMTFEPQKRHVTFYDTEYFSFELCTVAAKVSNGLSCEGGTLDLVYFVELRGADMEHTHLSLCVEPCEAPQEPVYTQITESITED